MNSVALLKSVKPEVFQSDLSLQRYEYYSSRPVIAVDTETRGLVVARDRLCLVQLCDDEGVVSMVRYGQKPAPLLKKLFELESVLKLFHFARFDVAVLRHWLDCKVHPIFCTKIASKLVRTYTDRHSLKDLARELLTLDMDKGSQSSDWAAEVLSDQQLEYAANDVRVLIPIYEQMRALLEREGRMELAQKLFQFIPVQAELDLAGFKDIFEH